MTGPVQTQIVMEIAARTVVKVPFDERHYPGSTLKQALEIERGQDPADIAQILVEEMSAGEKSVSLSWTVTFEEAQPKDD